jgi:hypothetical protein
MIECDQWSYDLGLFAQSKMYMFSLASQCRELSTTIPILPTAALTVGKGIATTSALIST